MAKDEVTVHVDASPEMVYGLVADITRMPEWSPECYRTEWVGGSSSAEVGARFKGHNRYRRFKWSTVAEIEAADPGRELTFAVVYGGKKRTRWSYRFAGAGGGTDVTETREDLKEYAAPIRMLMAVVIRGHAEWMPENMRRTLERLKGAAEKSAVAV